MWFLLALAALLCWSGSDLFSKLGSRPDDKYSHWKMVMAVGLVMGLHASWQMLFGGVRVTWSDILTYLPASALYIGSMILGYVGLRYIELSLSSPICNSSGALAAFFSFLFLQTAPGMPVWIGVALVAIGTVTLGVVEYTEDDEARLLRQESADYKYKKSLLAFSLPLLYCLLDAAGTVADSVILETLDEEVANAAYELTFLGMGVASFIYVCLIRREKLLPRREGPKLLAGVFETVGQFAYVFALSRGGGSAMAVVSAYCAVSVLWGRLFLHEKLTLRHYAAILCAFAGIVLLGFFDV